MGYFRFFYYIAYTFNFIIRMLKRHGKQILWIVCIFGFLIFCMWPSNSHAVYSGDYSYSDANYAIYKYYDSVCIDFLRRIDKASDNYKNALLSYFNDSNFDCYIYYGTANDYSGLTLVNGGVFQTTNMYVLFYQSNLGGFTYGFTQYDDYVGVFTDIISLTATSAQSYRLRLLSTSGTVTNVSYSIGDIFYLPDVLLHYQNSYIYEYFINNKSLEEIELLYEMNSKLDSIEDTMTELPVDNSISSDELPTNSGVDTTDLDNGLNGLFGQIAEAFTDIPRSKYNITVPVPFTDKSFVIPYNLTSSALSDSNFSWVTSIISAFWYYVVGRYILIDIINKFEHIQSGNIENMENDNIKEDLL